MTDHEKMIITKYDLMYEQRMTSLECISKNLVETTKNISERLDQTSQEIRNELKEIRKDMKTDFRWILFVMGVMFAVMAHGFKWF